MSNPLKYETIVVGTRARLLTLTVLQGGEPVDLSDAEVTVKAVEQLTPTNVRIADAEATGGDDGVCEYQLTAEDVEEPGDLLVQWLIEFADGRPYRSPAIPWRIEPAI